MQLNKSNILQLKYDTCLKVTQFIEHGDFSKLKQFQFIQLLSTLNCTQNLLLLEIPPSILWVPFSNQSFQIRSAGFNSARRQTICFISFLIITAKSAHLRVMTNSLKTTCSQE